MTLVDLLFAALAITTVAGGVGVAISRNVLTSAFSLLFCLLGVAGLQGLLGADLVAVAQVLVYVGGVLVLVLFAIMLTRAVGEDVSRSNMPTGLLAALAVGAFSLALLGWVALHAPWPQRAHLAAPLTTAPALGAALLNDWLLPFELISLVLLAALLGAVALARKEVKE